MSDLLTPATVPSSIQARSRMRYSRLGHDRVCLDYEFVEDDVTGQIIGTEEEVQSTWRTVLDAHERGGRT